MEKPDFKDHLISTSIGKCNLRKPAKRMKKGPREMNLGLHEKLMERKTLESVAQLDKVSFPNFNKPVVLVSKNEQFRTLACISGSFYYPLIVDHGPIYFYDWDKRKIVQQVQLGTTTITDIVKKI